MTNGLCERDANGASTPGPARRVVRGRTHRHPRSRRGAACRHSAPTPVCRVPGLAESRRFARGRRYQRGSRRQIPDEHDRPWRQFRRLDPVAAAQRDYLSSTGTFESAGGSVHRSASFRMAKDRSNGGLGTATDGHGHAMRPLRVASTTHQYAERFLIGGHQRQLT